MARYPLPVGWTWSFERNPALARAIDRQSQTCRLGHLAAALMSAWFQAPS